MKSSHWPSIQRLAAACQARKTDLPCCLKSQGPCQSHKKTRELTTSSYEKQAQMGNGQIRTQAAQASAFRTVRPDSTENRTPFDANSREKRRPGSVLRQAVVRHCAALPGSATRIEVYSKKEPAGEAGPRGSNRTLQKIRRIASRRQHDCKRAKPAAIQS